MVQSARVDIDLTGKFERTRPLALESHIVQSQWDSFADDVDRLVLQYRTAAKPFQVLLIVGPLLGMALFAIGGFLRASGGFGFSPFIFVGPIIFIGCPILSLTISAQKGNKWKEEMKIVAQDTSKKFRDVTIHFKEERIPYIRSTGSTVRSSYTTNYFFELSYKEDLEAAPIATMVAAEPEITLYPSAPTAPYVDPFVGGGNTNSSENKPVRERLNELEKVKDLISPEEYEEKRKAILSSI